MKKNFIAAALLSTTLSGFAANNQVVNNNSADASSANICMNTGGSNDMGISDIQLRDYSNAMIRASYNRYFVEQIGNPNYRKVRDNITRLENAIGRNNMYEMVDVLNECAGDPVLLGYFMEEARIVY